MNRIGLLTIETENYWMYERQIEPEPCPDDTEYTSEQRSKDGPP